MGKLMQIISAMAGVILTSSRGMRQDVTRYHARCRLGALGERQKSVKRASISPVARRLPPPGSSWKARDCDLD